MQRGVRIFTNLNDDSSLIPNSISKGRSKTLLDERNRCMFYRYWYYSKRHKMRYDEVLKRLSREFNIAEQTIINVISRNQNSLKEVYEETPKITTLRREFEYLTWK